MEIDLPHVDLAAETRRALAVTGTGGSADCGADIAICGAEARGLHD